jgi:hypothetical protein
VGPKGKLAVEEKGIEAFLAAEVPSQLEHLLGVNEIRIAVETSSVQIAYFFSYWQLSNVGWNFGVIPDAVFAIRGPERRAFAVEYDRGTEPLAKLLQKLRVYDGGLSKFPVEAVLIITQRGRRLELLGKDVRGASLSVSVLTSTLSDASTGDFFHYEFADLSGNAKRKLLAGAEEA